MVCEESEYRVRVGQRVQVCLQLTGSLSMDVDEDDLFVVAEVYTQPITAGEPVITCTCT